MVAETRPSIEYFRATLDQQPDLAVVGEVKVIDDSGRGWDEWRMVYVAPRKPSYGLRGIQTIYSRFLKKGFKVCNGTYQDDQNLHLGDIQFDEGIKRRLLISVYPDEEMAKEAYEWDNAFRHGSGQELRAKYISEGRREPLVGYVPNHVLREKWLRYQAGRIRSALLFWNRPAV